MQFSPVVQHRRWNICIYDPSKYNKVYFKVIHQLVMFLRTVIMTDGDFNKVDFGNNLKIDSPDRSLSDRSQRSPGAGV